MGKSERPPDIPARTFVFAARILRLVRALPHDVGGFVVARQLARCGTSVGANVEEAPAAHSRADFTRQMNIARAEAKESLFWLRLLAETSMLPPRKLQAIITEGDEIVRILTSIVAAARRPTAR